MEGEDKKTFSGFNDKITLEDLRKGVEQINKEREWGKFHEPRNLLLALVGEVGELCEILQWKGEMKEGVPELSEKEREHLGQELSDVLLYLVLLSDKCHIDLPVEAVKKMELNKKKYPAEKSKGSTKKYNEL